ncbi:MAG: hypothetical protein NZ455_00055 [Bacteroidia bacterium]|nr:hypothetical protein [Bacteroidia bacterium]MDW8346622.1 hypothetical protein [Bacteroidia bacterium]
MLLFSNISTKVRKFNAFYSLIYTRIIKFFILGVSLAALGSGYCALR